MHWVRAAVGPVALVVLSCAAIAQPGDEPDGGTAPQRHRESIRFAPATDSEDHFACTLSGELKVPFWGSHGMDGTWTMTRKVLEVDADRDQIRTSMTFDSGTCKVAGTTATIAKQPPLMCTYDTRHRLLQIDPSEIPPDTHGMDGDDIITLSGILVLLCETVPYHVRSARVGTKWVDEYECVDVNDRRVRVSGTSELIAFVDDGDRRVGVIESDLQIPVTGNVAGAHLIGRLECHVLTEVYVDNGSLRYRDMLGEGTLAAGTANVEVDDLHTTLAVIPPEGDAAKALYTAPDAGAHLIGRLDCHVLTEVYVDDGSLRYRDMLGEGTLAAGTANVEVDDLHTTLAVIPPEGDAAKALYTAPDAGDED